MENKRFEDRREPEIAYSRAIKAGKRIYYLDVKKAKNDDLYLCITESKKRSTLEDEHPQFEKHKLFLYKEDFAHFTEGLEDVINFVKSQVGEIEQREEWIKPEETEESNEVQGAEPIRDTQDTPDDEQPRKGFFSRLRKG